RAGRTTAAGQLLEPRERAGHACERERERDHPTAVGGGRNLVRPKLRGCGDLRMELALEGMVGEPVAGRVPAAGPEDGEHPGVLAGAVVEALAGRPTFLRTALEVLLGRGSRREQPVDRRELVRVRVVRGAGDCDQAVVELGPGAHERQRLQRLRGGAEEGDEARVTSRREDPTVPDGDGVDAVSGLDDPTPAHGYADRLDGQDPSPLASRGSLAARGLREALVGAVDQPVRHAPYAILAD